MKTYEIYIRLIRLGIGKEDNPKYLNNILQGNIDWEDFESFAFQQGSTAVVMDALDILSANDCEIIKSLPQRKRLEWIGNVLNNYETRYDAYIKAMSSLARFYNENGYRMMLLKGYACGLNWPNPKHRPYGDIDIWLFGNQASADETIKKERGIKVDTSHHHHTTFEWDGFLIENHYDFVNTKDLKTSRSMEKIFNELGMNDSYSIDIEGERVYLPSPDLHALFLIRHLALHFASVSINLRQMIDWGFFVEKHTGEINWSWLCDTLKKYHMMDFFNCINAICVGDLGFSARIFPNVQFDPSLKDKMVKDILEPEFVAEEPKHFFPRLLYKYQRWQGNAWKQNLCFGESRRAFFWRSLWAHLLKPKSL